MGKMSRLWHSIRLFLARGSRKKKAYADRHGLFAYYGTNVVFQPHTLPLYSKLISIHDNVVVGRGVELVTHDVIHRVFNPSPLCEEGFGERIGCIEIMDNSFVGNGAIVMYGVRIAENNIIAAGSVVTRSTEPNSIYAGVPARKIGVFSESAAKRLSLEKRGLVPTVSRNQNISEAEVGKAWELFNSSNATSANGKGTGRK
ncbi:acyltransferase [Gordonibacter sp. 28C]|uniref:acyltransferase n=1 Tax=Gordonibacter sp. 28C TaxID=2078569 RepID=UPI000DF79348|nr:acyltransferase [Gordonibacter sp. 28C]RDB63933.1 acyltransferase [Gordonibacter sp. 28C]